MKICFHQLKYLLEFQICPVLIRFLHQMDIWSSTCEQFCAESDDFRKKEQREGERESKYYPRKEAPFRWRETTMYQRAYNVNLLSPSSIWRM